MMQRSVLSLVWFAAAGAWPGFVNALETLLTSPFERAARDSVCGSLLQGGFEVLSHCAVCWAGSTLLIATGVIVFVTHRRRRAGEHALIPWII